MLTIELRNLISNGKPTKIFANQIENIECGLDDMK